MALGGTLVILGSTITQLYMIPGTPPTFTAILFGGPGITAPITISGLTAAQATVVAAALAAQSTCTITIT